MKIWLQSGSALAADAGTAYGKLYEDSLARHFKAMARPDTELKAFGIGGTPFGKDRYTAAFHLVATKVIESVMRAEPEGYDAVAVINTYDHGYYELRELLGIPVVFISESAMYLACQLAPTFSFVTHTEAIYLHIAELARRYGVAERMVRGANMGLTYEDFPKMYADPKTYIARFAAAAREAIARGATILMVAGNPLNMFLIDQGVKRHRRRADPRLLHRGGKDGRDAGRPAQARHPPEREGAVRGAAGGGQGEAPEAV